MLSILADTFRIATLTDSRYFRQPRTRNCGEAESADLRFYRGRRWEDWSR